MDIPEDFVSIQICMSPEVIVDVRSAARRSGLSIEDWLIRLLARGLAKELTVRRYH